MYTVTPIGKINPSNVENTEEIQHAVCKIMNGEFEAVANATMTRQLKGVCTARELSFHIQELHKELAIIKNLILQHKRDANFRTAEYASDNIDSWQMIKDEDLPKLNIWKTMSNINQKNKMPTKLQIKKNQTPSCDIHHENIIACNNTIQESSDGNIFLYYWKISNINRILENKNIYISSDDFYVLGHQMHLQLYPNHLGTKFVGIQLRPVTNFHKMYKITIINNYNINKNINSKIMGDTVGQATIYTIESDKLKRNCENNILNLKCTIFLDS